MGCKTIPEQLAAALGKTNVNTSDQLPIVENNTLYRATVGDLATSLGLTGSLSSVGGVSDVPLLGGTAPNYTIKKLQGSQGVAVTVNPSGGVNIQGQIIDAGNTRDGAAVIQNRTADTIALRRIKSGNSINITQQNDSIIIDNTQVSVSNNTRLISELSDFPDPVSGVITLESNIDYLIVKDISTTNRFVMGNDTVVRGVDPRIVTLTYTGTGVMFTTTNGNQALKELNISCANGTLVSTLGNTTGAFLLRWLFLSNIKNYGSVEKPLIGMYDILVGTHTGSGWVYPSVAVRRLLIHNWTELETTDTSMVFLDIEDATFNSFSISNLSMLNTPSGTKFLKGAAGGVNIVGDTIGYVSFVNLQGGMVGLDGISTGDAGWSFSNCNNIIETDPHALIHLTTPATTTITDTATKEVVNGVFAEDSSQMFDTNTNGRITYKGKRNKFVRIDLTMSLEPDSGTNRDLTVTLAKNGGIDLVTTVTQVGSTGKPAVVSVDWGYDMQTNDFIEVYVGNITSTNDVIVNQMLFRTA